MRLQAAMDRAEARKQAVLQDQPPGVHFTHGQLQDRAIFSGFDVDHDELTATATAVARAFHSHAAILPLVPLFVSAWCDGLLTGLFAAQEDPE